MADQDGGSRGYGIGELAEAAGVSVKTVRFYSDSGLLPEAGRSPGGHRRYDAAALERLRTVRRLRALGVALPAVAEVLRGDAEAGAALAAHRAEVERQLTDLRWRQAALEAVAEQPGALDLVGDALRTPPDTDALAAFWRRVLPLRLPPRLVAAIVDAAVPELPGSPTPAQALAYARLHAVATDRGAAAAIRTADGGGCDDAQLLYEGLGEAYALARRGAPDALDCFVAAHARAERTADSPAFRRALVTRLTRPNPHMAAYWAHSGALRTDPAPDMGTTHAALTAELAGSVRAAAPLTRSRPAPR
ncbi:MerR family transcriptional regulator [Kitasatospora sp. NPDC049258]|uniref:helix-turn-helix domain-containing protein n=1 Tax=Kitasatospora sp. NPDC049258 TaxID=3155394 RepID=UPI003443EEE8